MAKALAFCLLTQVEGCKRTKLSCHAIAAFNQFTRTRPHTQLCKDAKEETPPFHSVCLHQSPRFRRGNAHFDASRLCSIHLRRETSRLWPNAGFTRFAGLVLYSARSIHTTVPCEQGLSYQGNLNRPPRLLVVQPRLHPQALLRAKLFEAIRLADSLEELRGDVSGAAKKELPPYVLVQSPELRRSRKRGKRIRSDAYFGAGTIQNVCALVTSTDSQKELDAVFVNATLTAIQQRNLERAWGKPVLDRVGLIIEIFGAHAETKEARLQVELAALNYKRSRLVRMTSKDGRSTFGMGFESEVVSARGRGSGGRGFISGAGEMEIQLQRRRISERKERLLTMLEEVRRTRTLHRDARKKHGGGGPGSRVPLIAVVGYTNAGKSSLVGALSHSNLYIDDKLFATLDPRSRSVTLPSGRMVILSDTVGFISDLPIQLVKAFHATLEEVAEADFLLHVIDSSAANADEQRTAVLQVLETIGVSKEKIKDHIIEVWNKVDLSVASSGNHRDSLMLDDMEAMHQMTLLPPENITEEEISSEEDDLIYDTLSENEETSVENAGAGDTFEYRSASWSYEGIPRIGTSVVEGTGLKELLHLIDKKIMNQSKFCAN